MRITTLLLIFLAICLPYRAYGQNCEHCSELLRHGIYDHFREAGNSSSYSRAQRTISEAYNELKHDIVQGNVKASYGLFSGDVSLSREQLESVAKQMVDNDFSQSSSQELVDRASSLINPHAVQSWRDCVESCKVGLKATTIYNQDDIGVRGITVTLNYQAYVGNTDSPVFDGVLITPENSFSCTGNLLAIQGQKLNNRAHTLSCKRNIFDRSYTEIGRELYAPAASITVSTSSGAITRQVVPIYAPPPVEIQNRLDRTEAQLKEIRGLIAQRVSDLNVHLNNVVIGDASVARSVHQVIDIPVEQGSVVQTWYFPIDNVPDISGFGNITVRKLNDRQIELSWVSSRPALLRIIICTLTKKT